jgi:hypothetical protein
MRRQSAQEPSRTRSRAARPGQARGGQRAVQPARLADRELVRLRDRDDAVASRSARSARRRRRLREVSTSSRTSARERARRRPRGAMRSSASIQAARQLGMARRRRACPWERCRARRDHSPSARPERLLDLQEREQLVEAGGGSSSEVAGERAVEGGVTPDRCGRRRLPEPGQAAPVAVAAPLEGRGRVELARR